MNRQPSIIWRTKWFMVLLVLLIIDISPIPFPLTATTCLYILLFRPCWFKKWVDKLYPPE
jgi:hypothetical protein